MNAKRFSRGTGWSLGVIVWALLAVAMAGRPAIAGAGQEKTVAERVAALELGMHGYVLGRELTTAQWKTAQDNQVDDAFPGTIKFRADDLVVVADQDSHRVLAMYQRRDEADRRQLRRMIALLMDRFGEPTTMAHDRMVYWAYDDTGKISEERFNEARKDGKIEVLATVKFQSDMEIVGLSNQEDSGKEEKGTIYFIISSTPLSSRFLNR